MRHRAFPLIGGGILFLCVDLIIIGALSVAEMAHDQSLLVETEASLPTISLDLSGTWRIEEEDKSYEAILDVQGNGAYTWQGGTIVTTKVENRLWEGTWSQPENDREGGFEVLLSKDFSRAEGAWWYTRVKNFRNIPPGITGGSYVLIRLPPIHTDKRRAHEED